MPDMEAAKYARQHHDSPFPTLRCGHHQWQEYGDVTWRIAPDHTSSEPHERVLLILCETCGVTPLEAITDA